MVKGADVVVFCTGYLSKHVPVYDQLGNRVEFKVLGSGSLSTQAAGSTYEVDTNCRLIPVNSQTTTTAKISSSSDSIVGSGLFGIGLGYSLKTTDHHVQAETKLTAKADSVGLYVKQIGHKLLPFLLGPAKLNINGHSSSNAARPKTTSVP